MGGGGEVSSQGRRAGFAGAANSLWLIGWLGIHHIKVASAVAAAAKVSASQGGDVANSQPKMAARANPVA